MKKFLTILLVGILAVCCVAMSACKKPEAEAAVYKTYTLTINGAEYALGDTVPGELISETAFVLTENFAVLEFNADGTVVSKTNGEAYNGNMTWTKDANAYTITETKVVNGETKTETTICAIDGEYITVEAVPGFLSYKLKKA